MAAVFSAGTHTDKQIFQKSHTCQHTVCFKPKANTKHVSKQKSCQMICQNHAV